MLPRPPFRGSATRYERRQLLWLCAIRHLLATEKLTLAAIRTRLHALSAPELEAFAIRHAPPGKLAEALGVRSPSAALIPPSPPLVGPSLVGAQLVGEGNASAPHVVRWRRVELALGPELHVRDDASVDVQELARRVRSMCDSAPGGQAPVQRGGMG